MLENVAGREEADIWTYIWGSPWFFSSKTYTHLIGHREVHPAFRRKRGGRIRKGVSKYST
jgi:hypothetical protein